MFSSEQSMRFTARHFTAIPVDISVEVSGRPEPLTTQGPIKKQLSVTCSIHFLSVLSQFLSKQSCVTFTTNHGQPYTYLSLSLTCRVMHFQHEDVDSPLLCSQSFTTLPQLLNATHFKFITFIKHILLALDPIFR